METLKDKINCFLLGHHFELDKFSICLRCGKQYGGLLRNRIKMFFNKKRKNIDWDKATPHSRPKFIFGDDVYFKNDNTRTPLRVLDVEEGLAYHNGIAYRKTWYYTLLHPTKGERYYSDECFLELILQKGFKMKDKLNITLTNDEINLLINKYKMSYDPDKHHMTKEEWDCFGDEYGKGLLLFIVAYCNG